MAPRHFPCYTVDRTLRTDVGSLHSLTAHTAQPEGTHGVNLFTDYQLIRLVIAKHNITILMATNVRNITAVPQRVTCHGLSDRFAFRRTNHIMALASVPLTEPCPTFP